MMVSVRNRCPFEGSELKGNRQLKQSHVGVVVLWTELERKDGRRSKVTKRGALMRPVYLVRLKDDQQVKIKRFYIIG